MLSETPKKPKKQGEARIYLGNDYRSQRIVSKVEVLKKMLALHRTHFNHWSEDFCSTDFTVSELTAFQVIRISGSFSCAWGLVLFSQAGATFLFPGIT